MLDMIDEAFVVGKGASLRGFEFNRLKDKYTICLNHSVFDVPNPSAIVFMDKGFWIRNKEFIDSFPGEIFTSIATGHPAGVPPPFGVSHLSGLYGLYKGLEIAHKVYLLGFDLNTTTEWPYYRNGFEEKDMETFEKKDGKYKLFYDDPDFISNRLKKFDELFTEDKERIFNCNPDSAIRTFQFVNIERVL